MGEAVKQPETITPGVGIYFRYLRLATTLIVVANAPVLLAGLWYRVDIQQLIHLLSQTLAYGLGVLIPVIVVWLLPYRIDLSGDQIRYRSWQFLLPTVIDKSNIRFYKRETRALGLILRSLTLYPEARTGRRPIRINTDIFYPQDVTRIIEWLDAGHSDHA